MIRVTQPGFYTTLQDRGRFDYQDIGVPVSGVMDSYSASFANNLLSNNADSAVLELTMTGPTLTFKSRAIIAITGADMSPVVNDLAVENNSVIMIRTGDVLSFGKLNRGFRAYLAIKDGFKSPVVLNSRSTYQSVTNFGPLMKGMTLAYNDIKGIDTIKTSAVTFDEKALFSDHLEVYEGPEFKHLSAEEQKALTKTIFEISKLHNRMAYQVLPTITNSFKSIITSPILPGTVQLTPSGQLIVLMRDAQTTGGYPRVLQLSESAINALSQKTTGDTFQFKIKKF
ncbi:MAG: biotin-dependent carboxyltransferase family protein [Winogradskyella sp.]|nr:biotin-dependent carboxyltransferase family protein [Winogradskyella sp.]